MRISRNSRQPLNFKSLGGSEVKISVQDYSKKAAEKNFGIYEFAISNAHFSKIAIDHNKKLLK